MISGRVKIVGFSDKKTITLTNVLTPYGCILLQTTQGILETISIADTTVKITHLGTEERVTAAFNSENKTMTIEMPSTYNHGYIVVSGAIFTSEIGVA